MSPKDELLHALLVERFLTPTPPPPKRPPAGPMALYEVLRELDEHEDEAIA